MLFKNKINCVIVGLGKMGLVYYNIIKNLNLNLVGVCDLNESRKKNLKKKDQKFFTKSFDKILRNKIDLLIISSTADYHAKYAKKAILQGVKNILIENGNLKNYMQDRQNARLMKMEPTGNGRRQSYSHYPMPRMTNTYMDNGTTEPEEIISSVKKGIYAVNFAGGQVDITNGKFVFSASEAYLVENGKVKQPLKGATLIGNGPDAMSKISLVGNDMALDDGIGTCGKEGQGVPVGVGQPTLLMGGITVGGTDTN